MFLNDLFPRLLFATDDMAAGADATPGGTGEDTTTGGTGEDTTAGGNSWWESDKFSPQQRDFLNANGLTVDDPLEVLPKVVEMQQNAEKRLGQPADQLISKPKDGQELSEWRRENAGAMGVPESPDGYEITKPELGDGIEWDSDFEASVRQAAHDRGLSSADLQPLVDLYADRVKSLVGGAEAELENANAEMMTALEGEWGSDLSGNIGIAKQAAEAVAAKANLDPAAMAGIAAALKPKVGDAGTIKLFHAIGEMMGEDMLSGLNAGGNDFGKTAAQARQELAALRAEGGEFYEASKKGDSAKIKELIPRIERLEKIANPPK